MLVPTTSGRSLLTPSTRSTAQAAPYVTAAASTSPAAGDRVPTLRLCRYPASRVDPAMMLTGPCRSSSTGAVQPGVTRASGAWRGDRSLIVQRRR